MARVVVFDPGVNDIEHLLESLDAERYEVSLVRAEQDLVSSIASRKPDCMIVYLDGQSRLVEILRTISTNSKLAHIPLLAIHDAESSLQPDEAIDCGALQILRLPFEAQVLNANVDGLIRDRQRLRNLQEELKLGQAVQQSLLPPANLKSDHFRIYSRLIPGGKLCGDYQDYRMLDEQRLVMLQADVSGNGFVTAMIASRIKAFFDDKLAQLQNPAALLSELNSVMLNFGQHYQIATACCLLVDLSQGSLLAANAGHRTTYWFNRENAEHIAIPASGPALGMFEEYEIDCIRLPISWPSSRLVVFTDGLIEFKQSDHNWVSEEQFLKSTLCTGMDLGIDDYGEMLIRRSRDLTEQGEWGDDVSLLVLDIN